jgi:hypothetical protein
MIRLRDQGKPWPDYRELAHRFQCSTSTIKKAIDKTPDLQRWAKREAQPRVEQQGLSGTVLDNSRQTREMNPEDDAAVREFIEKADPETKAWFLALSLDQQLAFLNDPDHEPPAHKPIKARPRP